MKTKDVLLCAGCLDWKEANALKRYQGHLYCVDCFPRATKGKAMELPGHGGER